VAIANKVQSTDGSWLSLDSVALYEQIVAVSERYNAAMERELQAKLGVRFRDKEVPGKRPIREIEGVPADLMDAWSKRRLEIEARTAELTERFLAEHDRMPTAKEHIALAQTANLETREAKSDPRSYAEQRQVWHRQAAEVLGGEAGIKNILRNTLHRDAAFVTYDDKVREVGIGRTIDALEATRSTFKTSHIRAEALRQSRQLNLSPADQDRAAEDLVEAVQSKCVAMTVEEVLPPTPAPLTRSDGSSVYIRANSRSWSTPTILAAEQRVIEAGALVDGHRIDDDTLQAALMDSQADGLTLSASQEELVRTFATSGRRVELGLAPAGTGKTTAMKVLAEAWRSSGGAVMGLAPTAVAASNLGDSIDAPADTIASLTYALAQGRQLPAWAESLPEGALLLVDEAGMASTLDLDRLAQHALRKGWNVRLLGDDQQLASVSAGGVLRDMKSRFGSSTLSELRRFSDPVEGQATLDLRAGNHASLGYYFDHDRVRLVADSTAEHDLVAAWLQDRAEGHESLMMAGTNVMVDRLNYLAREHRIVTDGLTGPTLRLRRGHQVSAGDVIVTRLNDRRLRFSATNWVKNSDRWTVTEVNQDESLTVAHLETGRTICLPAEYVAAHVDLGYASTVHGAQGMTVDRAHVLVTGTEARQQFYVAMSRARHLNRVYVVDPGNSTDTHSEWLEEGIRPKSARELLEAILDRDGSAVSATTTRLESVAPERTLAASAARFHDAIATAAGAVLDGGFNLQTRGLLEAIVPGVSDAPSWPRLLAEVRLQALSGVFLRDQITTALTMDPLPRGTVDDVDVAAEVLTRIAKPASPGTSPVPWLGLVPKALFADPAWSRYLTARRVQLSDRITIVRANARSWTPVTAPPWAAPYLAYPDLVADLAVWRAVNEVDAADTRPTGPVVDDVHSRLYQQRLTARISAVDPHHEVRDWSQVPESVIEDQLWPVLARRLAIAQDSGVDVEQALSDALAAPLPMETPAAALWYRLRDALVDVDDRAPAGGRRLQPSWTSTLTTVLPESVAAAFLTAPEWGTFVDQVEAAREAGVDVEPWLRETLAGSRPSGDPVEQAALLRGRLLDHLVDHESTVVDVADERPIDTLPLLDPPTPIVQCDTPINRLLELADAAGAYYTDQYRDSSAARYIAGRFGTDLADQPVMVGYAPAGWDNLATYLRSHAAATDQELVDAGLARWTKRGTVVDIFRDRVLFGLRDTDGALVGFTGRCAPGADPATPKYINTPTTPIFVKGTVLFGLHEHREQLQAGALPVRVEGPMDAIAVTLAGNGHAVGVAPLGTALTVAQGHLIADSSQHGIVLSATDHDSAGQKAAARDYSLYTQLGLDPRELVLVNQASEDQVVKDPADAFKLDPESLSLALTLPDIAPSMAAQVIRRRLALDEDHLVENAGSRVHAARDVARIIAALPPHRWIDEMESAAAAIAHYSRTPDAISDYRHALLDASVRAALNWTQAENPVPPSESVYEALQALLSDLQQSAAEHIAPDVLAEYETGISELRWEAERWDTPEDPGIEP